VNYFGHWFQEVHEILFALPDSSNIGVQIEGFINPLSKLLPKKMLLRNTHTLRRFKDTTF